MPNTIRTIRHREVELRIQETLTGMEVLHDLSVRILCQVLSSRVIFATIRYPACSQHGKFDYVAAQGALPGLGLKGEGLRVQVCSDLAVQHD